MLVLTRLCRESIFITCPNGDRLEVFVVETRFDRVRLGIEAPEEYAVHRAEIQAKIDAEETEK